MMLIHFTSQIKKIMKNIPDKLNYKTIMILGHNPGCADFLEHLCGKWHRMPTAATALLRIKDNTKSWKDNDNWEKDKPGEFQALDYFIHMLPKLNLPKNLEIKLRLHPSENKKKCLVLDVSSNFTTFGPVEDLKWKLWNHRKSYLEFKNRFNWISKEKYHENRDFTYLLCEGMKKDSFRCSLVYKKKILSDKPCPICNSYASTDLYKENKIDKPKNDNSLHQVFFEKVPKIFSDMNHAIWKNMEFSAWRDANIYEKLFLSFCLAFDFVSGDMTHTENEFWNVTLQAEKKVRQFLFEKEVTIPQQEEFIFSHLSDGLIKGRIIRTVQTNYGISLCGENFIVNSIDINERKFQKALQVVERIAAMGVTNTEELPYYKIN